MSEHLEEWEAQQEAKRAAAHKEGPLAFLAGGGTTASRREREERRVSESLTHEALERKALFETTLKALREANFPDEITHFRGMLLKLNLTALEQEELQKVLLEKVG
jgi:hypothetical protein